MTDNHTDTEETTAPHEQAAFHVGPPDVDDAPKANDDANDDASDDAGDDEHGSIPAGQIALGGIVGIAALGFAVYATMGLAALLLVGGGAAAVGGTWAARRYGLIDSDNDRGDRRRDRGDRRRDRGDRRQGGGLASLLGSRSSGSRSGGHSSGSRAGHRAGYRAGSGGGLGGGLGRLGLGGLTGGRSGSRNGGGHGSRSGGHGSGGRSGTSNGSRSRNGGGHGSQSGGGRSLGSLLGRVAHRSGGGARTSGATRRGGTMTLRRTGTGKAGYQRSTGPGRGGVTRRFTGLPQRRQAMREQQQGTGLRARAARTASRLRRWDQRKTAETQQAASMAADGIRRLRTRVRRLRTRVRRRHGDGQDAGRNAGRNAGQDTQRQDTQRRGFRARVRARARAWVDRAAAWDRETTSDTITAADVFKGWLGDKARKWKARRAATASTTATASTKTDAKTDADTPTETSAPGADTGAETGSEGHRPTTTTTATSRTTTGGPMTTSTTSVSTGSGSNARILHICAEDFAGAAARWETDDMMICETVLRTMHEVPYAWANGIGAFRTRLLQDYPVEPVIVDMITELRAQIASIGANFDLAAEAFGACHREDIDRRRFPKVEEWKWDIPQPGDAHDADGAAMFMHEAARDFADRAGSWGTEDMMVCAQTLDSFDEIAYAWARGLSVFVTRLREDYPVDERVLEQLSSAYEQTSCLANGFLEIGAAFRAAHASRIQRRLAPRNGEHKWNQRRRA